MFAVGGSSIGALAANEVESLTYVGEKGMGDMSQKRLRVRAAAALGLLALLLAGLVAGCGGGGNSSSSNTSTESTESSSNESSGTSAGSSDAKLEELLAPYLERPTHVAQTQPLKTRPEGKTIAYMECTAAPCKVIGLGIKSAVKALGANYKGIQAGESPETFQAAVEQAVEEKPAVLILGAVNGSLVKKQVEALKAEGVKTINWSIEKADSNLFDVNYLPPSYYEGIGSGTAAYIIEHGGTSSHVLFMNYPLVGAVVSFGKGIEDTLGSECPDCSFEEVQVSEEEVGSAAPAKVVSVLQQHPEWEYQIVAGAGSLTLGVPQAVQAAGLKADVCCSQASAPNTYEDLKSGVQEMGMDVDLELLGYYAADAAARMIANEQPLSDSKIPWYQLIEGKDVTFDPNTESYHPVPHFEEEFAALWSGK